MRPSSRLALALLLAAGAASGVTLAPSRADAFCGFYVGSGGAKLFNNASVVVLLRDGTRTVLSMQNNYQGPPESFAMVVPVPVVLKKEDVKTLPREVFDRVDQLAAPRLVEYWEENPCPDYSYAPMAKGAPRPMYDREAPKEEARPEKPKVVILAQFAVGEYNIVILGADDSMALDQWLRKEGYKIPDGAEPYLRPYVQAGMKFFVAKVDPKKVRFEGSQAMLSPLRFHYDSESFNLPIRLGLVNSSGTQDLLVHVLARGNRFEVANYKNVAVPTNLDVNPGAKKEFPAFYASLLDHTLAKHPGAVVTEYAWDASSCDPCPTPPLQENDLFLLGGDVSSLKSSAGVVLTRLHARYRKDNLGEDLIFKQAGPLQGGSEGMEPGAHQGGGGNAFQGRYVLRHPWGGPITCKNPQRGMWGGPPPGIDVTPITPVRRSAFAQRDPNLLQNLLGPLTKQAGMAGGTPLSSAGPTPPAAAGSAPAAVAASEGAAAPPEGAAPGAPPTAPAGATTAPPAGAAPETPPPSAAPPGGGCAGCAVGGESAEGLGLAAALGLAGLAGLARRRGARARR